jgi:hypothetical protein
MEQAGIACAISRILLFWGSGILAPLSW